MADAAKLNAVKNLRAYGHCFLSVEGVDSFATVFGVKLKPYRVRANPQDEKGLAFKNGACVGAGMAAEVLAGAICDQLGVKYRGTLGRGFQLHACCDALEAHFSK